MHHLHLSNKRRFIFIVFGLIFILSLLLKITTVILEHNNIYLYTDKVFHERHYYTLVFIAIVSVSIMLFVLLRKALLRIILVVLTLIVVFYSWLTSGWDYYEIYFTFVSPDGKHTVIIEECQWLLGGWSNVYEKTGRFLVKKLMVI